MNVRMFVILKSAPVDGADELMTTIAQQGFTPLVEPILAIEPVAADFTAIPDGTPLIVTSGHALRLFMAADARRDHPVYAVGAVTANLARENGFTTVFDGGGTAETLADLLKNNLKIGDIAAYYLRGADISQDLAGILGKDGLNIAEIIAYTARPAQNLSQNLLDALTAGDVNAVLFHSRRGAEAFAALVRCAELTHHLRATKALCLSKAVLKSVSVLPFCQCLVAERPDRDGMMMLVEKISISKQEPV